MDDAPYDAPFRLLRASYIYYLMDACSVSQSSTYRYRAGLRNSVFHATLLMLEHTMHFCTSLLFPIARECLLTS